MNNRNAPKRGLLYVAINRHRDAWAQHFAQRVVQAACEKDSGFSANVHARKLRLVQAPPPSIPMKTSNIERARRLINDFGQDEFVFASKYRKKVVRKVEDWEAEVAMEEYEVDV